MGDEDDEENIFKRKSKIPKSPIKTNDSLIDESNGSLPEKVETTDEEKEALAKSLYEEKRKNLLSLLNDEPLNNNSGAIPKLNLCVECSLDTKDYCHIICERCNKTSHIECVKIERFSEKGSYRCTKCPSAKRHAKNKIYANLKSELMFFIANHEVDKNKPSCYGEFVHESCEINDWPSDDDIEVLSYQIDTDKCISLMCISCNKNVENDKALVCKGCLTLFHPECCNDSKGNEIHCKMCKLLIERKIKLSESHMSIDYKRPTRKRENKLSIPRKVEDDENRETRTSNTHVNHSDDDSSDEDVENVNVLPTSRNALRVNYNASPSHTSDSRKLRDELHRMQLNQILHKNLPPLYEFSQWESFYTAYEETKRHFSASQNVERIKNAIKCATVKAWGKNRMFELETYDERIQYINKTYNLPTVILRAELQKLTKRKRIASHERLKLAEFINDVEDFCVLQTKKGSEASRKDENMIRAIIEILPREIGESYVNHVHNKNQVLCIENLNKFLQKKMFGLIYNNPEILAIEDSASNSKNYENDNNAHKQKGKHGSFNNSTASIVGCGLCDDKRHTIFNCRQAWKLSGRELSKKLRDKRICLVCGQEPFGGKDHKCSKPSNKFCNNEQHKNNKHYEILCSLREPQTNSQNQTRETNYENHNTNRNNSTSRGRGRGSGRSGQNNSRRNSAQSFLNQNNSNNDSVQQHAIESGVNSVEHNNSNPNSNNSQTVMNTQQGNTPFRYCTFLGSFFNMNKSEPTQWKTSETLLSVIIIKIGPQKIPVSFLLDTGSAISMIETYVAETLEEQGQTLPIKLNWSGDVNYYSRSDPNSRVISVLAEAFNKNETKRVMHFHTFKNLSLAPQTLDVEEVKSRYNYLKSLNLGDYKNIHGVIGQDQINMFKINKQFSSPDGSEDCYLGYETPMGDYVSGTRFSIANLYMRLTARTQMHGQRNALNMHAPNYLHNSIDINELDMLEKRLMGDEYFEEPPLNDRVIADEQYAISMLENEMYKDENGKFVAPLIFKDENPDLPAFESFCAAKKRHFTLMSMLTKHDKIEEVNDEINKMLVKGYCEKVPKNELRSYDMTYYLPIFCISPPNKRTRIIWDGRAECSAGKSLNSFLLPGPNLYNNILQIYLNMRSENILIVGDLEEMFHQIVIKPEHRNALRFLWTDEINKEPVVYRMTRLVFGVNCAPFIAQFAVKLTVKKIKNTQPQIAEILSQDIYMDDIVTTAKNLPEGQNLVVTLKVNLNDTGFNLVKLKSSHPEVFDKLKSILSNEELAQEKLFPDGNMHRVLGYLTDFNDDTFGLGIRYEKFENFLNENIYPSKRDVLVLTRSIYDRLGIFTFLTSKFKYIYHLVCNEKLNWEDPIPHELYKLWKQALLWLSQCCNIRIPRCYMKNENTSYTKQLWAFSDASDYAECVVIYYRLINNDRNQVNVSLIMGKDFIIPKNVKRTIPELELDAATRAIMLIKDVIILHTKITFNEIYLAVDNTSVFSWLIYGLEKPTIYVKNRLVKISEANQNATIKWVPTEFQAADYGTKFTALPELHANNEWFYPNLFRLAEEDWISDQFLRKTENTLMITNKVNTIDWNKFSSLNRLIEIVRRTGKNLAIKLKEIRLRKLREKNDHDLQAHKITRRDWKVKSLMFDKMGDEIERLKNDPSFKREEALNFIVKEVQAECYSEELKTIASGVQLPLKHSLGKLFLCIKEGILCNTSRIPDKVLQERFKNFKRHTIVLPKDHQLTKLIIMQAHVDNNHFHLDTIIAKLTKSYYIPHIRSTVKKAIRENCYLCRKINRRPHAPMTGDLPVEKLCVDHSPFTNIVIDMAGPFMTKTRKTRSEATLKRYLLVVICLTTRAMHIEIMNDASSDSFIKALLITFELRGYPNKIISDRGTNFIGADNSLKKLLNEHNQQRLKNGLTPHKFTFEFEFNPAKSPHMQGSVERLIGNLKTAMNKMKKFIVEWSGSLDDATFRYLVISIVGMMNNRPICPVQIKGTTSFLTPNSFIMNRENNAMCPSINPPEKYDQLWSTYLRIQNILWEHFVDHCVPQWITREKWLKPTKNFDIGEIVLTLDHRKMNDWRLARVIDIEKGSNNQVRKLTLMLGKRPQTAIPKFNGNNFEAFAKALYDKGKCYKVTRAAAHVIKLDLYCEESIPNSENLEELLED